MIDMTVSGLEYEIEASGEVLGEKLSSNDVLWMGPLEGELEIDNTEYLVMVGFTKLDELVQISVTIQSMGDGEEIEPVRFSFGDNVITQDIYQEITENKEPVETEPLQTRSRTGSTYSMNSRSSFDQIQLEGGGSSEKPYKLMTSVTTKFTSGPKSVNGQTLYGYFDEENGRVAVAIRSYCSNLQNYYKSIGNTSTYIESMKYTIKRGVLQKSRIDGMEAHDFKMKDGIGTGIIMALFADVISLLEKPIPMSVLTELSSNYVEGTVEENRYDDITTVDIKFGTADRANFDKATGGVPIVFSLEETSNGYNKKHDYILMSSIKYRSIVETGTVPRPMYTVYYDTAKDASCEISVDLH